MNDGLKEKYRKTIISILASNERVERVVLFGSRAMETFSPESDVDLILYGEHLTSSDRALLSWEIDETTIPQRVELILEESLKNNEFREQVEKYGIEWYRRRIPLHE